MADFSGAINLIRKYEGFNEKAYADPSTGGEPYTFGYGTQYYPDGSPVKRGHFCSREKALEYLFHEVEVIDTQLTKLNLGLDDCMRQALISFIHSIGWEPFLYSEVIDCIEKEEFYDATQEISEWVFDGDHKVVGSLLDRRRDEIELFTRDLDLPMEMNNGLLLAAFRNYSGAAHEVNAIRYLESMLSPYILSEFANSFRVADSSWIDYPLDDFSLLFNS